VVPLLGVGVGAGAGEGAQDREQRYPRGRVMGARGGGGYLLDDSWLGVEGCIRGRGWGGVRGGGRGLEVEGSRLCKGKDSVPVQVVRECGLKIPKPMTWNTAPVAWYVQPTFPQTQGVAYKKCRTMGSLHSPL
jgi:hypothetical protein